jgi:hypothetical protein
VFNLRPRRNHLLIRLTNTECGKSLFQMVKTINAPVPLSAIKKHRARVMPQFRPARTALIEYLGRCFGTGLTPLPGEFSKPVSIPAKQRISDCGYPLNQLFKRCVGQNPSGLSHHVILRRHRVIRELQPIVRGNRSRIRAGKIQQQSRFRSIFPGGTARQVTDDVHVITTRKFRQQLHCQLRIGIFDLMKILDTVPQSGFRSIPLGFFTRFVTPAQIRHPGHELRADPSQRRRRIRCGDSTLIFELRLSHGFPFLSPAPPALPGARAPLFCQCPAQADAAGTTATR